ncbi:MarR family winged helix-turn-helix transcriptional regulator [Chthonobacter rhizosphaerae]|uniref:MarR family winged helix-turn-helix transcriptional regulator n=1 Tax=Chthonobacter rhizosphaerae TaxID=2735553 RepID=UPI0015EF0E59|nr:MarR family transcriptional regulator [Chthonobacter rhizosphaerae]
MGDPGDALALSGQLCFAVYAAAHAFNRLYRPLLDPLGLTYPQYLVMLALWAEDGRTVSSIGKAIGLDSGTLTPLLKRLEASGLVTRARSRSDERQVVVTLTEAGRTLKTRAAGIPAAIACAMGGDRDRIASLRRELEGLRRTLLAAVEETTAAFPADTPGRAEG